MYFHYQIVPRDTTFITPPRGSRSANLHIEKSSPTYELNPHPAPAPRLCQIQTLVKYQIQTEIDMQKSSHANKVSHTM